MWSSDFWKGKRVVVTGGAGFIGSNLVRQLLGAGARVRVADNLERGRKENLREVWPQIEFMQVDLVSFDNCCSVTAGMEIVMNLAAKACGLEYSLSHHGEMLTYNTLLGFNVLEAARQNGVERVLVVSTSCVYPDNAEVPVREEAYTGLPEKVNEGYAFGKMNMESQATYYAREYGMKIAIVRPNNAYGAGDIWDGEKSHVIPALIKRVLDGENPVVVWGSGNQSRAFVHVRDVAKAFMLVTERYAVADPVNVGHENETTIGELARKICECTGRSPELFFDRSKPEGTPRKSLSSEKLRLATGGYVPDTQIDDGLREMVTWFQDNYVQATSPSKPVLTIVTPVYCEDELIVATIEEVQKHVHLPFEMLIVYDFEEDTTLPYVKKMIRSVPELKLVRNDRGRGVINALCTGFAAAQGEYIVVVNGDLSDDIETINAMLAEARAGYDLVCGTRYSKGGRKLGGPFIQDLLSRVANYSFSLLTRCPTRDVTNSFKLFRASYLKTVSVESSGGFELFMELTIKARSREMRITEVPTVWHQRKAGESKFRIVAWLRSYLRWYWAGVSSAWFGRRV